MGRRVWRLIMLLTLASLRRQALVASVAKPCPPASCFVAPTRLPRPRGLHGAPMPIRPLGLRAPTGPVLAAAHAAAHAAAAGPRAAPPRAVPPPLAALRMDSEVEPLGDGRASHFFASLTPNRTPESAIGSTRLRLDRSMTLLEQHLVYSRLPDQPKEYVQDRMRVHGEDIATLLQSERTHIFICGLKGMEAGVDEALADVCRGHGLDWSAIKPAMREGGRYHVETY